MAKLKDVDFARTGEPKETVFMEQPFSFPEIQNVQSDTVPEQMYQIFRLVKRKQRRLRIDGICDGVLNPKTKKRERIWLLRGAHSIWQSELTDLLKDKEYVNKNRMSLLFEDGILRVPVVEDNMLEFARHNTKNVGKNRNGSGKYDYYEYNAEEEQKIRLEKQMTKIKVIQAVSIMEDLPMRKLAFFLGIRPTDELGMPRTVEGIRTELLLKADTQPDTVSRFIGSPEVEIAYLVRQAIIEAKIDLSNDNAMWAGGKGFIAKIPSGKKAYEYLTELAMTNSKEGKTFKEQLEAIIT